MNDKKEVKKGINIDNFEDGQYEMDDSEYDEETNKEVDDRMKALITKNTEKIK